MGQWTRLHDSLIYFFYTESNTQTNTTIHIPVVLNCIGVKKKWHLNGSGKKNSDVQVKFYWAIFFRGSFEFGPN